MEREAAAVDLALEPVRAVEDLDRDGRRRAGLEGHRRVADAAALEDRAHLPRARGHRVESERPVLARRRRLLRILDALDSARVGGAQFDACAPRGAADADDARNARRRGTRDHRTAGALVGGRGPHGKDDDR